MASSRPIPVTPPPGVVKTESARVIEGRFSDSDKIRFVKGRAQKIGGWSRVTDVATSGKPRALHAWRNLDQVEFMAAGTHRKLYAYDREFVQHDVTPLDASGSLATNPFAVTNLSATVVVNHTTHGRSTGDGVFFAGATAGGGITISGAYTVVTVVNANSYTITHSSAATSTVVATGGAAVTYQYEISAGTEYGAFGLGYGVGPYGQETWGNPRAISTIVIEPRIWSIDHWGKLLIATPGGNKSIYEFDPDNNWARAVKVTNAPTDARYAYVIPERFIIALCDAMEIKWCSQNERTLWTAAASNTAGNRTLTVGTKLIAGRPVGPSYSLIWTDAAVYVHQWTGSSLVFNTRLAGERCGLIAPSAVAVANGIAYWMGTSSFFQFAGSVVPIPNADDIKEYVFQNLRTDRSYLTAAAYNSRFNEVWWLYVDAAAEDIGFYVIYHIDQQVWAPGILQRVSGANFEHGDTRPYMAGNDGHVYLHEEGHDDNGTAMAATLTLAPTTMDEGGQSMKLDGFVADFHEQAGDLSITFDTWDRLRGGVKDTQTKTVAETDNLVDLRVEGRYIGMTLRSNTLGGNFRMGKPAVLAKAGARRR